jgi:death-on-curing protein
LVNGHPFVDGNKRTAAVALLLFADLNEMPLSPEPDRLKRAILALARGRLDRGGFERWLRRVATEPEPEE